MKKLFTKIIKTFTIVFFYENTNIVITKPTKFCFEKVRYANKQSKEEGLIVGIKITIDGGLLYEIAWSSKSASYHYEQEIERI